jgi:hypothetical protein
MYAALSRSACALLLNLIWDFETTSSKLPKTYIEPLPDGSAGLKGSSYPG